MTRAGALYAALGLVALVVGITPSGRAGEPAAAQSQATLPSSQTVRSLLMNNWSDTVAIHYSRKLYGADSQLFGPYLSGLHGAIDWPTSQIDGATALMRGDVLNKDGTPAGKETGPEQPQTACPAQGDAAGDDTTVDTQFRYSYPSVMCFDDGGILRVDYRGETRVGLPVQIQKSYAMPPNEKFLVVQYDVKNNIPTDEQKSVRLRLSEVVDLNNRAAPDFEESADRLSGTGLNESPPGQTVNDMHAEWHPELNAWLADMTAANGTVLVFGAFQDVDRHRVFQTVADDQPFDRAVGPEMDTFERPGTPDNVDQMTGKDLGLAAWRELMLGPGADQKASFFYAVTASREEAQDVARRARQPGTPDSWFDQTRDAYRSWLRAGQQLDVPDPGLREAYTRALVTAKQSQQPEFGGFVAATNPAYGFKVWARDASVTALSLAAAGHLDEARKYYRWMASIQEGTAQEKVPAGGWYTVYSYWANKKPVRFVEPENDALGLFAIGVYHTWRTLNARDPQAARAFLTSPLDKVDQGPSSVYEAVARASDYIKNNIDQNGFGPQDYSIWEEQLAWNTFTQVTYASGLSAAALLAEEMGDSARAQGWLDAARRIRTAILRPSSAGACPGLWNDGEKRLNRATTPSCTPDARLDASTDLIWVFGLIDAVDEHARTQRDQVLSKLTPGPDDIGIARYEDDRFYFDNKDSPGGPFEAGAATPSWPQMDMYMSMLEHWNGQDDVARDRLEWYVKVTNAGYMPPGEAVDWRTDLPLPSTASEPVTGAWYVLGLLNFLDRFDPRLPSLQPGVGATPGPSGSPPAR